MSASDVPAPAEADQLETDQVFIDTQAFVREHLNWQSKSCVRLRELVRSGHIQVLTTSVTRAEVRSKIGEGLEHARSALRRHDVVLRQIGCSSTSAVVDGPEAEGKLQFLFDAFMGDVKAVEIPLSKNVDGIFDAYFHARPPFSAKKKSEFPDAFVVASLRERAQTIGRNIYVVSEDPDLKACCAQAPELLIVAGLSEIISKATVTKAVHDTLSSFLKSSAYLHDKLTECLTEAEDITLRSTSRPGLRIDIVKAGVGSVDEINMAGLNVISRVGTKYFCVLDFEAYIEVWLELQVEFHEWYGEEDHDWFKEVSTSVLHNEFMGAEIEVVFDTKSPESASIEQVYCRADISIDPSEIDELRRYLR